jgi:hypothetical protein
MMSQHVTLSAIISAAQFRRAGVEALAPRFATPFTRVYRCSKNISKTAIFAIFQGLRCGSEAGRLAQQGVAAS